MLRVRYAVRMSAALECEERAHCETDGSEIGAPLTAYVQATLDGTTVHTTIESVVCGNAPTTPLTLLSKASLSSLPRA